MKTKTILITLVAMLAITALVFQSCKKDEEKDEEKTNQPPTCKITSPTNGQEFTKGKIVTFSVDANDSDGSISEVRFFIDNVGKSSATSFPYNYSWNTNNEDLGNHTLKATSFDNSGGINSDEITVAITESGGGGGSNTPPTGYFTDTRDGQEYGYIDIENQTWMAENLNYQTSNSWWYDNNSANGDIYGRLYTWEAALNACPSGWSLPSDDEWKQMEMALGMSQSEADGVSWRGTDQGKQMKSTSGWYNNGNGTNSSGFNALPGGFLSYNGSFYKHGKEAFWWLSSESYDDGAMERSLYYDNDRVERYYLSKTVSFSVRCLKD